MQKWLMGSIYWWGNVCYDNSAAGDGLDSEVDIALGHHRLRGPTASMPCDAHSPERDVQAWEGALRQRACGLADGRLPAFILDLRSFLSLHEGC
jgi:hypothetical protein